MRSPALSALSSVFLVVALVMGCGSSDDETGESSAPGPASVDASPGSSESPGNGRVGDACSTDSDCSDPPNAECFKDQWSDFGTTFPNGYCTKGCIEDDIIEEGGGPTIDCGSGSCIQESGGMVTTAFCAKLCDSDTDCRVDEGYTCKVSTCTRSQP